LRDRDDLDTWPGKGASFEGLVVGELMARAQLDLQAPRFTFYRTQAGAEVDLLVENGREIFPIEIKHSASVSPYDIAGLRRCMEDLGISSGFIVTRGDSVRRLGNGITVLPWEQVVAGEGSPWDRAALSL
jgi:predicted AAA+ superfamily ATPase